MADFIDRIKWWLQTVWTDKYNPEPRYISVPEDAVERVEIAVLDILADPGLEYGIWANDQERLIASLAELTGKPRDWIEGWIKDEIERREERHRFYDCHMRGGVCGG